MVVKLETAKINWKNELEERMITVSDGVDLKVTIYPAQKSCLNNELKRPIVFIGGWLAHTESYLRIINRLREEEHEVIYIETREKNSSTATEDSDLSGERMFRDIQEILYELNFESEFIMLGHSLGAICSILQALDESNPKFIPSRIIALQPVTKSVLQKEQIGVFKLPTFLFKMIRKLMVKIAPFFSSKLKQSEFSRKKFEKEFLEADAGKLRKSALGFEGFSLYDHFREISIPILFLGVSEDEQHPVEDPKELSQMLPLTEFHDLVSEEVAFSERTADLTLNFLKTFSIKNYLLPK
jgi:pimeloyl-ACP methyl ester carboxylesterase